MTSPSLEKRWPSKGSRFYRRSRMPSVPLSLAACAMRRLNAARTGAIGSIYYSGHGAAEKDTNIHFLIPVDANEPGSTAFWDESVKLDDVLRLLDGARGGEVHCV